MEPDLVMRHDCFITILKEKEDLGELKSTDRWCNWEFLIFIYMSPTGNTAGIVAGFLKLFGFW